MKGRGMSARKATRVGLLSLLAISACVANGPSRVSPVPMSGRDGDAVVSYDEFVATVDSKAFERLDQDSSGTVSPVEWRQFDRTVEASQDFEVLDTDRDDEINPYEWQANLGRSGIVLHLFRYLDGNRDDYVSRDELRQNSIAAAIFAMTF